MVEQITRPLLMPSGANSESTPLDRLVLAPKGKGEYDESWLQKLLFARPELLPIEEISRTHSAPIPLCREMETGAGPIDLVYINEQGMLTLVECKLWRNPEARREVVGQILEYAAHINSWTYEQLRDAVRAARRVDGDPISELVAGASGRLDSHAFIDDVQRCLEDGRFLLLVVGDGIRRNVLNIAELLRRQAGISFTFGLIEMAMFRLPKYAGEGLLVQPRILANSIEISREVIYRKSDQARPSGPLTDAGITRGRIRLDELEIRERLGGIENGLPDMIYGFLGRCSAEGVQVTSRRSLMIHHVGETGKRFNLGTFYFDGNVNTNYIVSDTEQIGDRSVGENYLVQVAKLLPGASVLRNGNTWTWRVVTNGRLPQAKQLLQHSDDWLAVIIATRERLRELESRQQNLPG